MDQRVNSAIKSLEQSKAEKLSYTQAAEELKKQGFTQQETDQAAYQFTYSGIEPAKLGQGLSPSQNQAFATAVVHEEAMDQAKKTQ